MNPFPYKVGALMRQSIDQTLGLAIAVLLAVILTLAFLRYTQDDVFITYTYSRNLAEGVGFVFNPGEQVQGTTTPLWAILMAGVYRITHDLLTAGNLLSGALLIGVIVIAYLLTRPYLSRYARIALALLIATTPILYIVFGMETLLYCFILMTAFFLWSRQHYFMSFAVAGLLTWTRADGVVLVGAFGLCLLGEMVVHVRKGQTPTASVGTAFKPSVNLFTLIKATLVYIAVITPWFIFATIYFGSPLPNTFGAKAQFFRGWSFLQTGWNLREVLYGNNPLHWLGLAFILIGLWRATQKYELRPLAVWTLAYLIGYTILDASYFWYFAPLNLACIVLAVIGGNSVARWLATRFPKRVVIAVSLVMALISVAFGTAKALEFYKIPYRMVTYQLIGEWIAQHTPPDSTLAVADLGVTGYYARRHTVDTFGLIVPDLYFHSPAYTVSKFKPDYIVTTTYFIFGSLLKYPLFLEYYTPLMQMSTSGDVEFSPMTVYKRRWSLTPPETLYQGEWLALSCEVHLNAGDPIPDKTTVRLFNDEMRKNRSQRFLFGLYPAQVAAGEEHLIEQIAVPSGAFPPGNYQWRLKCAGNMTTGDVTILPLSDAPGYMAIDDAIWESAALRGMWMPEETWSGGSVRILLEWEAIQPFDTVYFVGFDVFDQDGRLWAQHQAPPDVRTDRWTAKQHIAGEWRINLPANLPEGEYTINVNWYQPETGETLPAYTLPLKIQNWFPGGSGLPF